MNCVICYIIQATTPDVATPLPSTSQPPSSVSLKTPASEHNVHDTFRYGSVSFN